MSRMIYVLVVCVVVPIPLFAAVTIDADNPYIQYYGRWDFSNPKIPTHSWPGVYIYTKFEGTSIGWITNDNGCWYNVFIDDSLYLVFKGTSSAYTTYTLASGLRDTVHSLLITKRGETTWTKFGFKGFVLDDGKKLVEPPQKPSRKIEFIGDSYTSCSGNEWTEAGAPPNDSYTNIYNGFPSITARHYGAQYHVTSRSGFGLVVDYQANYNNNLPDYFDRTLYAYSTPKWNYDQWIPNVVVICLGLNDYNGWGGYSGPVHPDYAALYKKKYHEFIGRLMDVYPGAKILCVAANDVAWIKQQVSEVVTEERGRGNINVFYTYFPYYTGEYVNNGHPNVSAHNKIAQVLISALDSMDAWTPYIDTIPPAFVNVPETTITATSLPFVLSVSTDSYANVRLSTNDTPYALMETNFTTTGTRTHSITLSGEQGREYTYYLRAIDRYGNETPTSTVLRVRVDTVKQSVRWSTFTYDHSMWKSGSSPLGNDGSTSIVTAVQPASVVYFRKEFDIPDPSKTGGGIRIHIKGHDGAVVYLNNTYLQSINLPTGANPAYSVFAIQPRTLNDSVVLNYSNPLNFLRVGKNVVSIEIHSRYSLTPSILFDGKVYDRAGNIYADFGSRWYYFDAGYTPVDQLIDKSTNSIVQEGFVPHTLVLQQNYPNPFNPSTTITFTLPRSSNVQLHIYNLLGQCVSTVVDTKLEAGEHRINFDGSSFAAGVYFYRLKTEEQTVTKRMVLLK
ncbi:MAG: T9SS type A sorting domain-containing protein [Bacteroidetes bacterium]|nr:T9SS type A sorting domain-containing protein [Bacteroidota bacterium]